MSFGFSVGDFLAVLELVKKVRKDWVDAPVEYAAIREETKNVDYVLREIDDYNGKVELTDEQRKSLQDASFTCKQVLEELQNLVSKYATQSGGASTRNLLQRKWKQFRLDPTDIQNLRARLVSTTTLLNTVLNSIQSVQTFEITRKVDGISNVIQQQNRDKMADWFAPADFANHHNDYLSRRHPSTGKWLLTHPRYIDWTQNSMSSLICPGIPGAGKSVLAATVINDLREKYETNKNIAVIYFYYNFRRQDDQGFHKVLSSLVRQLFQESSQTPDAVLKLYEKHRDRQTRPSIEELKILFSTLITSYDRTLVVLDALDECSDNKGSRAEIVRYLLDLQQKQANSGLSFLATTRFVPEVMTLFDPSDRVEIRASEEDIRSYVLGRMNDLPSHVGQNIQVQQEIVEQITARADGMFLLAVLHFDSLQDKTTPRTMRRALEKLPKGDMGLSHAYKDALLRVDQQPEGFRHLGRSVIMWITYAKREMTIREIQEALAIEPGMNTIDEQDDLEDAHEMLGSCAGLVVVDSETNIVRLVHYTTQEYLLRECETWLPHAHSIIAKKCLAYLSMFRSRLVFTILGGIFAPSKTTRYTLLDYVMKQWGHHAAESYDIEVDKRAMQFLENGGGLRLANLVIYRRAQRPSWAGGQMSPLHIAAYFNMIGVISDLLREGAFVNKQDREGYTPLGRAVDQNCLEAVKTLLAWQHTDVQLNGYLTPLHVAVRNGFDDIIRLLFTRSDLDVNAQDESGDTPLHVAGRFNRIETMKLLLTRSNLARNARNFVGETTLHLMAFNGRTPAMKLILTQSALNIDARDYRELTSPALISRNKSDSTPEPLLAGLDVEIDAQDSKGFTPLFIAAWRGEVEIVQLLLDAGADINLASHSGTTPLHVAVEEDEREIVKLLLTHKPDTDLEDYRAWTPLALATELNHEEPVRMIQDHIKERARKQAPSEVNT